jgi:CRISPR/Cas system-associated exonuclease Cas4 (RecB family)
MEETRPHFSVTQLRTYLECPFKYYLAYEEKLQWERVPSGVAFGSAMHRTIEEFNRALIDGRMDEKAVIAFFADEWRREGGREEIEYRKPDEREELMGKGKRLVQLYCQQFADMKPQAVERTFRLPILDVSTGLFESSRDILGKIDLISDDGVIELKTSARSINQRMADTSLQLTLYSWAYRIIYGREEKSLKTVALLKTAKSKIQTVETCRTAEDHSRLMELISQVIRAVELRVFYRNPATRYGCDGCVYRMACGGV